MIGHWPTSGAETGPYKRPHRHIRRERPSPPSGLPGGDVAGNYGAENFYEVGSDAGVEGFGGSRALSTAVASGTDPQLSWSTAETYSHGDNPVRGPAHPDRRGLVHATAAGRARRRPRPGRYQLLHEITGISFANFEDVTATYPYANMTSFWKNLAGARHAYRGLRKPLWLSASHWPGCSPAGCSWPSDENHQAIA